MGLDPAGRTLDPSMPRYALTRDDLDDLVLYLKELGRDLDHGITEEKIVVGTILAPHASLDELHVAVKSVLAAYFREVNVRGGIYGRRVELQFLTAPEIAAERAPAARRFLKSQEAFALVWLPSSPARRMSSPTRLAKRRCRSLARSRSIQDRAPQSIGMSFISTGGSQTKRGLWPDLLATVSPEKGR